MIKIRRFQTCLLTIAMGLTSLSAGREPDRVIDIWPESAPGETTRAVGEALPRRANENPPATRVTGITRPQLHVFQPPADRKNGAAALIFPGGAYNYVVSDKEGSEAAAWLNSLGITGLVVHYRTKSKTGVDNPVWRRPLQDGQRAVSLVRQRAADWGLDPAKIGVLGFSAGGQAAALVTAGYGQREYEQTDDVDSVSCRPDFSMLVYPWRLIDDSTGQLMGRLKITADTPPALLVHTHDDHATSLGSVLFYTALKQNRVPAELHIYERGGHGYGMRPVENSTVDTWPERAADWLRQRGLVSTSQ